MLMKRCFFVNNIQNLFMIFCGRTDLRMVWSGRRRLCGAFSTTNVGSVANRSNKNAIDDALPPPPPPPIRKRMTFDDIPAAPKLPVFGTKLAFLWAGSGR